MYAENLKITFHAFKPSYKKLTLVDNVRNGVMCKGVEYVVYNVVDDLSKYRVEDFSLGNLIAVGAIDKLQPTVMSVSSDMTFVDNFERAVTIKEN